MRRALLILFAAAAPALVAAQSPAHPPAEYVQAVEFPYYLYPRAQWERELTWMKTIGVRTVEFSIPWNWHQLASGEFDFTGRTSPRRDLTGLIRILRGLGLRAWVRPLPPVAGWANAGWPAITPDAAKERAWFRQLEDLLATQTEAHGGPVAFVDSGTLSLDATAPPAPVTIISATDPAALTRSRSAITSARGSLLWTDVEDAIYPAGWESGSTALLHKGAVGLSGEERSTGALRREAELLRNWRVLFGGLRPVALPKLASGRLPRGVTGIELVSRAASAVSLINRGSQPFHQDVRVIDPRFHRALVVPGISVGPGDALWFPINVSLGGNGLCRECTNFSSAENIIYATAELLTVEYENGILAMEFAAPQPGEVLLQLAREPVGPLLAAGKPTKFDWDAHTLRARLPIPASKEPGNRVRIGLAIEEPDTSAFFSDLRRLLIGQKNLVSTVYSSPQVAARSRLREPQGFTATPMEKSPNEIEYTISVPADALHGDFASFALEADGLPLGRARPQLLRPLSIRLAQALGLHFGPDTRLTVDPPTAPAETRSGGNLEIIVRNNSQEIRNYQVQPAGDGLEFLPARAEIAVGGVAERPLSFRVFGNEGATGLRVFHLRVTGGAEADLPMRVVLLPRTGTVAWSADLDGDGSPEWILESAQVRAVFSARDGGRWMDLTWKDTDADFLSESGAFAQSGPVSVQASGDSLAFSGQGWTRTVRLAGASLTIQQTPALPKDLPGSRTAGNVRLSVDRNLPESATFTLRQTPQP
jgi:glycosyl hydrolase family 35